MEYLKKLRRQHRLTGVDQQQGTSGNPTKPNSRSHSDPHTGLSETPPVSVFPDGVKVLHHFPNATVDIYFVYGLTGDRDSTWTAYGQSAPWPQNLLSPKLKKARILTYGYDAYIVRKTISGLNRQIDHATNLLNDLTTDRVSCNASSRPIIFVAHSLGGLVCKEAILLSDVTRKFILAAYSIVLRHHIHGHPSEGGLDGRLGQDPRFDSWPRQVL